MIKPIAFRPLPEAPSPLHSCPALKWFVRSSLPAVAIRGAGASLNAALAAIQPYMPSSLHFPPEGERDYNMEVNRYTPSGAEDYDEYVDRYADDLGLHIDIDDHTPVPDMAVNAWHLESGLVRGTFVLPGPLLIRELRQDRNRLPPLPLTEVLRYGKGLVNTGYLLPMAYRIQLRPHDLVLCKDGWPVAHEYRTIGFGDNNQRLGLARIGRLNRPSLLSPKNRPN